MIGGLFSRFDTIKDANMRYKTTATKRSPKKRLSLYLDEGQIEHIEAMKLGFEARIGPSFIYSFNQFLSICIDIGLQSIEERSNLS